MVGFVCVSVLAAFGLLSAIWLFYGMCCGKPEGTLLILSRGEHGLIRRCMWLREMGLFSCRMVLIDPDLDEMDEFWITSRGIEIWRTSRLGESEDIGER